MSTAEIKSLTVVNPQSQVAITSWEDLEKRAEKISKSQLIPTALRGKPADIAIILQIGWELDIPPMQAINGIDVIQGKPAVSPQLAVALARQRLKNFYMRVEEDPARQEVRVTMARDKGDMDQAYTAVWNDNKARPMGLLEKDNYKKQKLTMYRWRATMEAMRMVAPDIVKGMYSPDEVEDMAEEANGGSKADRIKAQVQGQQKPEPKEVIAEVEPAPTPTVQAAPKVQTAPKAWPESILGEWVITVGAGIKGHKLADIEPDALDAYIQKVKAKFADEGRPVTGPWMELVSKAEAYLMDIGFHVKAEPAPQAPVEQGNFDQDFFDAHTLK
jgi:hypothetical protein